MRWRTRLNCWHNRKEPRRCKPPPTHRQLCYSLTQTTMASLCRVPRPRRVVVDADVPRTSEFTLRHVRPIGTHTQSLRGVELNLWNSLSRNSEETSVFPNVPSQPGMIQFPLWPTVHTALSHPILSNSPTQFYILAHATRNPSRRKDWLNERVKKRKKNGLASLKREVFFKSKQIVSGGLWGSGAEGCPDPSEARHPLIHRGMVRGTRAPTGNQEFVSGCASTLYHV